MDMTVSFTVNQVCAVYNKTQWLEAVYQAIVKEHNEEDVEGVQVYPANWPRKIRILVGSAAVKERLCIAGLNMLKSRMMNWDLL